MLALCDPQHRAGIKSLSGAESMAEKIIGIDLGTTNSVVAVTEGVVRPPSALGMTTGSPPSMTATTELVVPRSIPMIFSAILSAPDRDLMPAGCYRSQKASIVPKTNAKKADAETPRKSNL